MPAKRDIDILHHIIQYCNEISNTIVRFGDNFDSFENDSAYKNAVALCVLQIGELTSHLSDSFKSQYKKMPWNQIKALRNIVAHNYGKIDEKILWETVKQDISALKTYCIEILN